MTKQSLLASVCVAALVLGAGSAAEAADRYDAANGPAWYVSIFGGAAFWNDYDPTYVAGGYAFQADFKTGFIIGAAAGIDGFLFDNLRHEVEVSYMETELDEYSTAMGFAGVGESGTTSSINLLFNTWYDVDFGSSIKPYIGGGVGVGFVDSRAAVTNGFGVQWDGKDTGLAFQAGAGLRYELTRTIALDVSYRFRGTLDVKFPAPVAPGPLKRDDFFVHTVQGGVTVGF